MSEILLQLVEALNAGRLRVVDLTLPLSSATPLLPLPSQWNNSPPFTLRELSRYDERGPFWYWNAFETGEHTGTHFDAPVHWLSGKNLPDSTVDRIPPKKFIGPACVIDVTKEVHANPDGPAGPSAPIPRNTSISRKTARTPPAGPKNPPNSSWENAMSWASASKP